jgi:hypothetical protein
MQLTVEGTSKWMCYGPWNLEMKGMIVLWKYEINHSESEIKNELTP